MIESKLKAYFENLLPVKQLSIDLKDSQRKTSYDVTTVYVDTLASGEFEIKKEHLIKLCNHTLSGQLLPIDLNTISFALISSDYFYWDTQTGDGEIIAETIFDWDNPDIGFDLTLKNLELWKEYLLTGNYKLDKDELKKNSEEMENA